MNQPIQALPRQAFKFEPTQVELCPVPKKKVKYVRVDASSKRVSGNVADTSTPVPCPVEKKPEIPDYKAVSGLFDFLIPDRDLIDIKLACLNVTEAANSKSESKGLIEGLNACNTQTASYERGKLKLIFVKDEDGKIHPDAKALGIAALESLWLLYYADGSKGGTQTFDSPSDWITNQYDVISEYGSRIFIITDEQCGIYMESSAPVAFFSSHKSVKPEWVKSNMRLGDIALCAPPEAVTSQYSPYLIAATLAHEARHAYASHVTKNTNREQPSSSDLFWIDKETAGSNVVSAAVQSWFFNRINSSLITGNSWYAAQFIFLPRSIQWKMCILDHARDIREGRLSTTSSTIVFRKWGFSPTKIKQATKDEDLLTKDYPGPQVYFPNDTRYNKYPYSFFVDNKIKRYTSKKAPSKKKKSIPIKKKGSTKKTIIKKENPVKNKYKYISESKYRKNKYVIAYCGGHPKVFSRKIKCLPDSTDPEPYLDYLERNPEHKKYISADQPKYCQAFAHVNYQYHGTKKCRKDYNKAHPEAKLSKDEVLGYISQLRHKISRNFSNPGWCKFAISSEPESGNDTVLIKYDKGRQSEEFDNFTELFIKFF